MKKEDPLDLFVQRIEECRTECEKIAAAIDDHLYKDAESINWSSVGDAARMLEMLKDITDVFCPPKK